MLFDFIEILAVQTGKTTTADLFALVHQLFEIMQKPRIDLAQLVDPFNAHPSPQGLEDMADPL